MKNYLLSILLLTSIVSYCSAKIHSDSLQIELDHAIENAARFEQAKIDRINMIKENLRRTNVSEEDIYQINNQLFHEYEAYIYDSASHYVNRNIAISKQLNKKEWLNESLVKKAQILSNAGLFPESMKLLEQVDKKSLPPQKLTDYYTAYINVYLFQAEYASGEEYMYQYIQLTNTYRDSLLTILPENSYLYIINKVPQLIENQQLKEAEELLLSYLPQAAPNTREYSILTSILSFIYECNYDTEMRKAYLTKSAISDIKAVVKENNSLRVLAELLYQEGEIKRADNYVKVSMEDANFYNARLRNLQASKMLPIIDKAYQMEKEAQRKELQRMLIIISILSVFLFITIIFVVRQMKKLAKTRQVVMEVNDTLKKVNEELLQANKQQKLMNDSLTEANYIKEEYIGRFLSQCSAYIDKLESYRRMLNKKASTGKVEELYKTLKSTQFIEDELKEFYQNFDNSFLTIFPRFVDSFNELLPPEEKITPRQDEHLTTELRIFALIRLGITDSAKIAGFLRYSITTIYTYRSKVKNKSLHKDSFEEQVMKIN